MVDIHSKEVRVILSKHIVRDKFGKLSLEPSFTFDGPIFYKVINPDKAQEGELWQYALEGAKYPTGKVDRKGKPIYIQPVWLIKRVEIETTPVYESGNKWVVKKCSGNRVLEVSHFEGNIEVIFRPPAILLTSTFRGERKIIEVFSTWIPKEGFTKNFPSWVTDEVKAQAVEYIDKTVAALERKKKAEAEAIAYRNSILQSGGPIPGDILREFVTKGVQVVWNRPDAMVPDYRMPFYGYEDALFKVGDFVFRLGIKELDEDYIEWSESFPTSGGDVSDPEIIKAMIAIVGFVANPSIEKSLKFLGIQKPPAPHVLLNEVKRISTAIDSTKRSGYYENMDEDQVQKALKEFKAKVEELKQTFTSEVMEYKFQDLISVKYRSELSTHTGVENDIEEGIGKKDATIYSYKNVVATVEIVWRVKELYIHPDVHPDVAKALRLIVGS